MDFVIDACCLINLDNVGALQMAAQLQKCQLWVTPLVVETEIPTCGAVVESLIRDGSINMVDENCISADVFADVAETGGLGDGETASIAACVCLSYGFCCDDKKARQLASDIITRERVIGSMRLLRWSVEEGLCNCGDAAALHRLMIKKGGFLPKVDERFYMLSSR